MEDYFSIDDILASEPRVFCTFRVQGHQLAHLDPMNLSTHRTTQQTQSTTTPSSSSTPPNTNTTSNQDSNPDSLTHPSTTSDSPQTPTTISPQHLPANHRLALPFWLIESLAERSIIAVELPRAFGNAARNALRADPIVPSLNLHCPYFFRLGIRLAMLLTDHNLPTVLATSFAARCWPTTDAAAYTRITGSKAVKDLDQDESALFFAAHGAHVAMRRWKERAGDRITPMPTVLGKRKQQDLDTDREIGSPITPPNARVRVS